MEAISNQFKLPVLDAKVPTKDLTVGDIAGASKTSGLNVEDQKPVSGIISTIQEKSEKEAESAKSALTTAVTQINKHVQNLQRNLQFTVDEVTGEGIVTVTDSVSNEVIRQIPSEEALELARRLLENEGSSSYLVSERA